MKKLIIISLLTIVFTIQSCEESNGSENVPEKVKAAFSHKFPNVNNTEWEMEDETEWEAEFKKGGKEYTAKFTPEGDWKETEHKIKEGDIPADIRSVLDQNFTDFEIEEAEIAETSTGKSYEFEIEVDEEKYEVEIDSNGNLTEKETADENADEQEYDAD